MDLIGICLKIDNVLIKRKANRLIDKVDKLSQIAKVKCNLPKEDLPDEYKINYLQKQIDDLAVLILNPMKKYFEAESRREDEL